MDKKDQLLADAEELGIADLDRRHSEETIQERIDEVLAGVAPEHEPARSAKTANACGEETESGTAPAGRKTGIDIRLKKDFWNEDGKRVRADSVVTLHRARAREMLDSGAAERIDPLP